MKSLKISSFIMILLSTLIGTSVKAFADPNKIVRDIKEVNEAVGNVGQIRTPCSECSERIFDLLLKLDKKELDMGKPYFTEKTYVIVLKRTKDTPLEVDLKFQNNYEVCMKNYAAVYGGSIEVGCILTETRFKNEWVTLDFKNLPKLSDGDEEIIEIHLEKSKDRYSSDYKMMVQNQEGILSKESIDKKFFSSGYNIHFASKKSKGKK